jgi:hypothetical protein
MSRMPLRWLSMRLERLLGLRRLRGLLLVLGPLCLVLEPTVIFLAGHSSVQRTNSGNLAKFTAILRASSFVRPLLCALDHPNNTRRQSAVRQRHARRSSSAGVQQTRARGK